MHPKTYSIKATVDGVMSIRTSKIDAEYRWIDVEPDIQKVYRNNQMRQYFQRTNQLSPFTHHNAHYREELSDFEDPAWRERVARVAPVAERFKDPNLLARGVVDHITPRDRYSYE